MERERGGGERQRERETDRQTDRQTEKRERGDRDERRERERKKERNTQSNYNYRHTSCYILQTSSWLSIPTLLATYSITDKCFTPDK